MYEYIFNYQKKRYPTADNKSTTDVKILILFGHFKSYDSGCFY